MLSMFERNHKLNIIYSSNWISHLQNHVSPQNSLLRKLNKKNTNKHNIYFVLYLIFPKNNWEVYNLLIQL
jgi:hypothetical protein